MVDTRLGSSIDLIRIFDRFGLPAITLVLLATVLFVPGTNAQSTVAQDHASLGISLAREGKLARAEEELRAAVVAAPSVALYRAQLASILGLQGRWQEALENFQQAIDLAPENLEFRVETAAVQWQLGLMPAAEKNVQYVLARRPGDPGATLLLGLVRERTGDYASAAQLLDSQFELAISQPERAVALFHSIVRSGQRDKITRVVDALKLRTHDKLWTNAIGQCSQIAAMGGDLETAEALFALMSADDAARAPAGFQLAKLLYTRDKVSQAIELLLQLTEHGTGSADLQALLGNCYEAERQPGPALQAYQRAINAEPSRIEYYEDPVSLLLDMDKTNEAMLLVNQALAVAPNDARPWIWKGKVELRRNAYQDAKESYSRAARLDNSNADAVLGIAAVDFIAGQSEDAIAEYKAGMVQFPNDARFYVASAKVLLASPDSPNLQAQAEHLLEKAVKLDPQSAEAHYQLGQLALQKTRLQDAEAEFSVSLRCDSHQSKAHFALSVVFRRMGRTSDAAREFGLYQDLKQMEERGTTAMTPAEKP